MGWRGSARHWHRYQVAYVLLAGLATPLVISVHTVVSFDFAVSQLPGWHTTIFPPYFVAGAIYSGFAMVLTLAIPLRRFYDLSDFITTRHLNNMGKVMFATGMIVAYGYLMEIFMSFFSGAPHEVVQTRARFFGPYAWVYWLLIACNIVIPQVLWFGWVRKTAWALFLVSLVINLGMWLERFVIVVTSLNRNHMESKWALYSPTLWDWATFAGSIGLFFALFFLFIRFLPMISAFEMRELVGKSVERGGTDATTGGAG
jgi:molybdopterin-containing oxidoreductase family membrane subunit